MSARGLSQACLMSCQYSTKYGGRHAYDRASKLVLYTLAGVHIHGWSIVRIHSTICIVDRAKAFIHKNIVGAQSSPPVGCAMICSPISDDQNLPLGYVYFSNASSVYPVE